MNAVAPLGFGLGLRSPHYEWILDQRPTGVDWFEFVTENFLSVGGRPRQNLEKFRELYPLVAHGVGLSIASTDPIPKAYLAALSRLVAEIEPRLVTDHLCWTRHHGQNSHDLLPLAYTRTTLLHVKERVQQVQDTLKRRIFLENPSAYISFQSSDRDEATFLRELCDLSGCGVLLDINNLYVNSQNLGTDPVKYLAALRGDDICYFHLAGHTVLSDIRIDTHDDLVPDEVWSLYRVAARLFPHVSTLVEWDDNIPEFPGLLAELAKARSAHGEGANGRTPTLQTSASYSPRSGTLADGCSLAPIRQDHGGTSPARVGVWKTTQDDFWTIMTAPQNVAPGDQRAGALVDTTCPTKPERGLNAYVDAYFFRIADSIRETYPSLDNVLGSGAFYALLKPFLAKHPPTESNLKYAARGLAEYLLDCELPADYGVPRGVLRDLAALEWARADVYDEEDGPSPVGVGALLELAPDDWETVGFGFVKALRLVRGAFAVEPVLAAVSAGEAPERPVQEAASYLVTRPDLDPQIEAVDEVAAALLEKLVAGANFLEACEAAAAEGGVAELDGTFVGAMIANLTGWVKQGLVAEIVPAS